MKVTIVPTLGVFACALALALSGRSAAGEAGPMQQLANELGTPKLGYTARDDAHTHSMFEFVRANETVDTWTKLFTVVASSVDEAHTSEETQATIVRIRQLLARDHATIVAFDVREKAPPVAYFEYTLKGESNVGVIFSPRAGIVTIQQVAAHDRTKITAADVLHIKALVGYPG